MIDPPWIVAVFPGDFEQLVPASGAGDFGLFPKFLSVALHRQRFGINLLQFSGGEFDLACFGFIFVSADRAAWCRTVGRVAGGALADGRLILACGSFALRRAAVERPFSFFIGHPVAEDVADVVEDDGVLFAGSGPQGAAYLLRKQPLAFGRPEQNGGADDGNVGSFGNDIAGGEDLYPSVTQGLNQGLVRVMVKEASTAMACGMGTSRQCATDLWSRF